MPRPLPGNPHRILLIKSHSAGIGDILRSSAAWAVLKKRWPDAELHLVFLTRWPGYPSETLIREHYLLSGAHFLPMQEGRFAGIRGVGPSTWRRLLPELRRVAQDLQPDLIVDHEPFGIETSIAARWMRRFCMAPTVGVNQVPGRGWLYDHAGPSLRSYALRRGLSWPMDYTERDFAALAGLGLARDGQRIVLQETKAGRTFRETLRPRLLADRPVIGLNIGCGTRDAERKRPAIGFLVEMMGRVAAASPHTLLLTGALNERGINQHYLRRYAARWGGGEHILDIAGQTTPSDLTGALAICDIFVSSDSGPYHMAVAMGVPTVALFNFASPEHYHDGAATIVMEDRDAAASMAAVLEHMARMGRWSDL
ncbi:glycosyltransferase family 9 protein [Acidithiobacillus ferrianus]|uniref:Lipopolysaccharide heptosyltransferase family protein n=2 Tax=Acidithiobacillus ferrianus TaxID=2678518 RepID=A0A845U0R9_9PROT|nr:glycosyltransferase family 9 protein [Acidithiobacillus ferrianus]NDU41152.1 lipopolysaccharide heptosyltransferase family protein [Acidithiobacillus ferrianus]